MKLNLNSVKTIANASISFIKKNDATILTGCGVTGLVATVGLAIMGTAKYIEKKKMAKDTKEKVVEAVKCYAPAAVSGALTATCIIMSRNKSIKKEIALAASSKILEEEYRSYRDKVKEILGEKEDDKVSHAVSQDKIEKTPMVSVTETGQGTTLFLESLTGRYFRSKIETVRRAENDFNRSLIEGAFANANEWFYLIGLDDVELGKDIGWSFDHPLRIIFDSGLAEESEPCIVLRYDKLPNGKFLGVY